MKIDIDGTEIINVETGETLIDIIDLTVNDLFLVAIIKDLISERDSLEDDNLHLNQSIQDLQEQIEMMEDNI